jgi:hypothetical protein
MISTRTNTDVLCADVKTLYSLWVTTRTPGERHWKDKGRKRNRPQPGLFGTFFHFRYFTPVPSRPFHFPHARLSFPFNLGRGPISFILAQALLYSGYKLQSGACLMNKKMDYITISKNMNIFWWENAHQFSPTEWFVGWVEGRAWRALQTMEMDVRNHQASQKNPTGSGHVVINPLKPSG